jgi:hypothetical protein
MRKQTIIGFWSEVGVAFLLLAAIVVVGVLGSGCVIKKKGEKFITIDGERFQPIIPHSEIRKVDTTITIAIEPLYLFSSCEHIWVQELTDDSTFSNIDFTPHMVPAIHMVRTGVDYSYTPLVCVKCYQKKNKVHKTDYGEQSLLPKSPILPYDIREIRIDPIQPIDSVLALWNNCEEDCRDSDTYLDYRGSDTYYRFDTIAVAGSGDSTSYHIIYHR